jgi:alpha-beta hydrolase superfamily lysophospholipase
MSDGVIERFEACTPDGWILAMRRTTASVEEGLTAARPRRPVLIVPGYGMNSFIFGYHPRGRSIEAHLAWRGFEVWSVDLRAQGRSRHAHGVKALFGLEQLALVDVNAAITEVLARTRTGATHVDVIGASLGAALMFGHAAVNRDDRLGSLVSFGGPLRWERVHPALALAFRSPSRGRCPSAARAPSPASRCPCSRRSPRSCRCTSTRPSPTCRAPLTSCRPSKTPCHR